MIIHNESDAYVKNTGQKQHYPQPLKLIKRSYTCDL